MREKDIVNADKPAPSKPCVIDDDLRPLFAAYLNMVRMNLFNVLQNISNQMGISDAAEEDNMVSMKLVAGFMNLNSVQRSYARRELLRSLPVLNSMLDGHVGDYGLKKLLQNLVAVVSDLRNTYTHVAPYDDPQEQLDQQKRLTFLLKPLDSAYDSAVGMLKRQGGYTENEIKFAERQKRWDNYFNPRTPDGKGLAPIGISFLMCKLLTRKYAMLFLNQSGFFSRTMGRQNEMMQELFSMECVRLPRLRVKNSDDKASLGMDMLKELPKCPRELFDTFSEADKMHLRTESEREERSWVCRTDDRFVYYAMRYIDEMDVLPGIAFQVSLGKYFYGFRKHSGIDGRDMYVSSRNRKVNGFGPLADVEKRRVEIYDKDGFMRHFEELKSHDVNTKPYISDSRAGYLVAANRVGLFWNDAEDSRNGARLTYGSYLPERQGSEMGRNVAPRCWMSVYDLPALVFLNLMEGDAVQVIKEAYTRLNNFFVDIETGALLPENDAADNRERRLEKLERRLSGNPRYGLHVNQIPKNMVDYLTGVSGRSEEEEKAGSEAFFKRHAVATIENEIRRTKRWMEKFQKDKAASGSKQNRRSNSDYVSINKNGLARFLAHDIMRLQQLGGKDDKGREVVKRIGRTDFVIMQNAIAEYQGGKHTDRFGNEVDHQEVLKEIFRRANLLDVDSDNQAGNAAKHPFLDSLMSELVSDAVDMYEKYLVARQAYFEGLRDATDYGNLRFMYGEREKYAPRTPQHVREQAARYREVMQLPDGLFTEALRVQMSQREDCKSSAAMSAVLRMPGHTSTCLIGTYFREVLEDDSQSFYREKDGRYRRHYKWLDVMGEDGKTHMRERLDGYLKAHPEAVQEKRRLQESMREFKDNERAIRRHSVDDMLLFLMAKRLLFRLDAAFDASAMKLKEIGLGEWDILSRPMLFRMKIELHDERGVPICDSEGRPMVKSVFQNDFKPKNYGDFMLLLVDTRIGTLLSKMEGDDFDRTLVERELDAYDNARRKVYQVLHAVERGAIEKDPVLRERRVDDPAFMEERRMANGKVRKEPCVNSFSGLLRRAGRTDATAQHLVNIRNAFSHNKYPDDLSIVADRELPKVARGIVDWLNQHEKERL